MLQSKVEVSSISGASLIKKRPVFGPNSKCLFCCSETVIKVFSTESGECIRNLQGHLDTVTGVIINPNNKLQILSCSLDQSVIQWDYSDGVLLKVYQFHQPLHHIALFSHHGQSAILLRMTANNHGHKLVVCNFPAKKESSPQFYDLIKDIGKKKSDSMAIGYKNSLIAVIFTNTLLVQHKGKSVKHHLDVTNFTCVACHPTELCIVTGCENGRIYYWFNVFEKVVKTYYHWHSLPVLDLCFTAEGSYLLSGGHECVLVKWQYNSHEKDFLPRLGAAINHIACSHDNLYYTTSHKDNVIQLITNKFKLKQVYQGLTCGRSFIQRTHPVPAGLHYEPRSRALVTNGKIGHLQFYSVIHDKHLYNLDIVSQNYISPENLSHPMVATEIIAADFSNHGDWLATVEMWDDKMMSPEIRLKFWQFLEKTQQYTLNTTVELPHTKEITSIKLRPDLGEEGDQPMAVTTSRDGYFKTWTLVDDTNIYRKNTKWTCAFSGYYRDHSANMAAFSEDGSLLCVGFGPVLTIWEPETNVLLQTLSNHKDKSDIQFIEFGKYTCSHLLVACSKEKLTSWNLSSCTVVWSVEITAVCLVSDPETEVMAVISKDESVYYFKPSSPDILYSQSSISTKKVEGAIFIPQTSTDKGKQTSHSDVQGRQLPTNSKLYFINAIHQLLCLSEVDTTCTTQRSQISLQENLPQSTLSLILSKDHSKQPDIKHNPASKDTQSWKGFLDTPPPVQPAVTSLCKQFVQSMLVKTGEKSSIEDSESSDNESVMEVDEDSDSEDEKVIQKKTRNVQEKPQDNQLHLHKSESQIVTHTERQSQSTDTVISVDDMNWYKVQ